MVYLVLIGLALLAGVAALVLLVLTVVWAARRDKRRAVRGVVGLVASVLIGVGCAAGVALMGARAVKRAVEREQARSRAEEQRHRANVEARKAMTPPAALAKADREFFTYNGFHDWWVTPLVYPYGIRSIDRLRSGNLCRLGRDGRAADFRAWEPAGVSDITRYSFDRRFLLYERREKSKGQATAAWGLFDFEVGTGEEFTSEPSLLSAANGRGFSGAPELRTVWERFAEYFESAPTRPATSE